MLHRDRNFSDHYCQSVYRTVILSVILSVRICFKEKSAIFTVTVVTF